MNKVTLIRGESLSINVYLQYNDVPLTDIEVSQLTAQIWFQDGRRHPLVITALETPGWFNLYSPIDTKTFRGTSFLVNVKYSFLDSASRTIKMATFNKTFFIVNSATLLDRAESEDPPVPPPSVTQFVVTYMSQDTVYATQRYNENEVVVPPVSPTREGYDFVGWDNLPPIAIADTIVTAEWMTAEEPTEQVKVIYMNGDDLFAIQVYNLGDTVVAPTSTPTKEGYAFGGWEDLPSTALEDTVVFSQWEELYSDLVYAPFSIRNLGISGVTVVGRAEGNTDEHIKVPPVYNGQPVIAIGRNQSADPGGFYMDHNLKSIELPNSIKQINIRAFSMSSLEEIYIPDSVVCMMTNCFKQCNSLTQVNIPASITTSKYWSTRDSDSNGWFEQCANLETINGLENLLYVPAYFVANCGKLFIPNMPSFDQISRWAFIGVHIGIFDNGCPRIGNYAFSGATVDAFSSVEMYTTDKGYQEQIWASMPFAGMNARHATIKGNDADFILCGNTSNIQGVSFAGDVEVIGDKLLYKALDITKSFSIDIPASVTSIGNLAFGGNSGSNVILLNFLGDAPTIAENAFGESDNASFIITYDGSTEGWTDIAGGTFGAVNITWKEV